MNETQMVLMMMHAAMAQLQAAAARQPSPRVSETHEDALQWSVDRRGRSTPSERARAARRDLWA